MWKAGGVEEGVILSIHNQGSHLNMRNAPLATALSVVMNGISKAIDRCGDVVVKFDEIFNFMDVDG